MEEEQLKYKVVIDADDVPAYLDSLKQQINMALETGPDPSAGFIPPSYIDPSTMPAMVNPGASFGNIPYGTLSSPAGMSPLGIGTTDPGINMSQMQDWLASTSQTMQQGYYKSGAALDSVKATARMAAFNVSNIFNRDVNPVSSLGPISLALSGSMGFGYDPFETTMSRGEYKLEAEQRMRDNSTLGMMDYGFWDFVGTGSTVGTAIGGIAGLVGGVPGALAGSGIGGAIGAVVGAGAYVTNAAMKPFYEEVLFNRNITRGLRDYSSYTNAGKMTYDERQEVADFIQNMDVDPSLSGYHVTRKDVENMFQQAAGTEYLQSSTSSEQMVERLKAFSQDFTKVMHIFKVAKEEVGKVVDTMYNTGIIDAFNGDIGAAARQIEGMGFAARLDSTQAFQMYQSGAEMFRGTGINMNAGGDLLLQVLSEIRNSLKYGNASEDTIRQLGGGNQAALVLAQTAFQNATSPSGLAMGVAYNNGDLTVGGSATSNYLAGISNITSYSDYLKEMSNVDNLYSKDGMVELVGMNNIAGIIKDRFDMGLYGDSPDKGMIAKDIARTMHMSTPQARAIVDQLSAGPEVYQKTIDDMTYSLHRRSIGEQVSSLDVVRDDVSNFFTGLWRKVQSHDYADTEADITKYGASDMMLTDARLKRAVRSAGTNINIATDMPTLARKAWSNIEKNFNDLDNDDVEDLFAGYGYRLMGDSERYMTSVMGSILSKKNLSKESAIDAGLSVAEFAHDSENLTSIESSFKKQYNVNDDYIKLLEERGAKEYGSTSKMAALGIEYASTRDPRRRQELTIMGAAATRSISSTNDDFVNLTVKRTPASSANMEELADEFADFLTDKTSYTNIQKFTTAGQGLFSFGGFVADAEDLETILSNPANRKKFLDKMSSGDRAAIDAKLSDIEKRAGRDYLLSNLVRYRGTEDASKQLLLSTIKEVTGGTSLKDENGKDIDITNMEVTGKDALRLNQLWHLKSNSAITAESDKKYDSLVTGDSSEAIKGALFVMSGKDQQYSMLEASLTNDVSSQERKSIMDMMNRASEMNKIGSTIRAIVNSDGSITQQVDTTTLQEAQNQHLEVIARNGNKQLNVSIAQLQYTLLANKGAVDDNGIAAIKSLANATETTVVGLT